MIDASPKPAIRARSKIPSLNAKQHAFVNFRSKDPNEKLEIVALLGDYGGGKTTGSAERFATICFEIPLDESKGWSKLDPPISCICGTTISDLLQGPWRQLMRVIPESLILEKRLYPPHYDCTLINGHVIVLKTILGSIEGHTYVQLWANEIQIKQYAEEWENIQSRVRDNRSHRLNLQVDGLAWIGTHVEDLFRDPKGSNRQTILCHVEDNLGVGINEHVYKELLTSMPSVAGRRLPDGWIQRTIDLAHPEFSGANWIDFDPKETYGKEVHGGVDLRLKSSIVLGCPFDEDETLVVFSEINLDGASAKGQAYALKKLEEALGFRLTTLTFDPTAAQEEVEPFAELFPDTELLKPSTGSLYQREKRATLINWGIKDASEEGKRRLRLSRSLMKDPSNRGVKLGLQNWEGNNDKVYEHAMDGLQYMACKILQEWLLDHASERAMWEYQGTVRKW